MAHAENRDLLEILKAELSYIEGGGYQRRFRSEWRAQFVFEDSPTCMNYGVSARAFVPCRHCVLMPLIPAEQRAAQWPCRRIPLNRARETLDSLYRSADSLEIEIAVRRWLLAQIAHLESERTVPAKCPAHEESPDAEDPLEGQRRRSATA